MDTDRGGGGEADRISSLPDHLLHSILLRLPGGTADAARTSVLSRRWRPVWAHLPELSLRYKRDPASSALPAHHRVDAALAACAAARVGRLEIAMPFASRCLPAGRATAWLLFASQRLAGELRVSLPPFRHAEDGEEVLLPRCETVTSITFDLQGRTLRFAGAFGALATLRITQARVDVRELQDTLSSRCPRLKELVMEYITLLQDGADPVLAIRSDSLQRLEITMQLEGRLHVDAPELHTFFPCIMCDFHIVAPKLSEVRWYSNDYDPNRHRLGEAGRHLRRLEIRANAPGSALMRRFDTVDELDLTVYITKGIEKYERFLENINKLTKCEALVVHFVELGHAFKPTMLHLLRKCVAVRKLVVQLSSTMDDYPCALSSGCPCSWLESYKTQSVVLDSLEEVEIKDFGEVDHKVELVRLLCKCSGKFQKRVVITVSESRRTRYLREKIRSIQPPHNKVEVTVQSNFMI
ncbi:hypothetical protein ACP70R_048827 [Stipagrostis hirtigluma subsp. patula]